MHVQKIESAGIFPIFTIFADFFSHTFSLPEEITVVSRNVLAVNLHKLKFLTSGLRYHPDFFHAMSLYVCATFEFNNPSSKYY